MSQAIEGAGPGPVAHLEPARTPAPSRRSSDPSFAQALDQAHGTGPEGLAAGLGMLRETARSMARGDQTLRRAVRAARAGRVFSHEELLALQAGVYRHTQELDLASKLLDKATSGVKHVLQSQR